MFSYEDTDYCVNANYNNYQTWYIPDVMMIHYSSMTVNNIHKYNKQNKQYFWNKWNNLYHTIITNQGISDDTLDRDILISIGLISLGLKII